MINLQTGELHQYDINTLQIKQTELGFLYFEVYQIKVTGFYKMFNGKYDKTHNECFISKELAEKFFNEELLLELTKQYYDYDKGSLMALDITQKYEVQYNTLKVFLQ